MIRRLASLLVFAALATGASAQRVQPYPVMPPPQFAQAVAEGTRTLAGAPGPAYWQNRADYVIDARLDAETATLSATGTLTYTNNSPDSLAFLVLKLRQNVHAPGVPRNRPVAVTGGMTLARFGVDGTDYTDATRAATPGSYGGTVAPGEYSVLGTIMTVALTEPLAPGARVKSCWKPATWSSAVGQLATSGRSPPLLSTTQGLAAAPAGPQLRWAASPSGRCSISPPTPDSRYAPVPGR